MADATKPLDLIYKPGRLLEYSMPADTLFYKGSLLQFNVSTGALENADDTSGARFAGIASETVDNTGGSAGDKNIRLYKEGLFIYDFTGGSAADLGKEASAADNQTLKTLANFAVGRIQVVFSSQAAIKINGYC
jgi:hypothetical protein